MQQSHFFCMLSDEELDFLTSYLQEKKYATGDILVNQGSQTKDLYLLCRGKAALWITLPGDIRKKATTLSEGEFFGEIAFLTGAPLIGQIICEEDCRCLHFPRQILEMLRIAFPAMAYKIEHALAEQIAVKVVANINYIHELLAKLPARFPTQSEHAISLPNEQAGFARVDFAAIKMERLHSLSLFQQIDQEKTAELLRLFTCRHYEKGYCFTTINSARKLYFIYTGAVMLFIKKDRALQKSIAVFGIGEAFLQHFYQTNFEQVASYVACERTTLLELDYESYYQLRQDNPSFFYPISRLIHYSIARLVYVVNRQFIRIGSEYTDLLR